MIEIIAAAVGGIILGAVLLEIIVRSWQGNRRANYDKAIKAMNFEERSRHLLRTIYAEVARIDKDNNMEVIILDRRDWQKVFYSKTLLVTAKVGNPQMEWKVQELTPTDALIMLRVRGNEPESPMSTGKP